MLRVWKKMSIKYKISFPVAILTIIVGIFSYFEVVGLYEEEAKKALISEARAVMLAAESTREFTAEQINYEVFKEGMTDKDQILRRVPIFSAMRVAQKIANNLNFELKVPKNSPRNPKNEPTEKEKKILTKLNNEKLPFYQEIDEENQKLLYFKPIFLTKECLECHGDPATSMEIWGNDQGKDVTGVRMEGWKEGEMHGAFLVKMDMSVLYQEMANMSTNIISFILLGVIVIIAIIILISRAIGETINKLKFSIASIAEGDFSYNIDVNSEDEVGEMAHALKKIPENIKGFIDGLQEASNSLQYGMLAERIKADGMKGAYAKVINTTNSTFDLIVSFLDIIPDPVVLICSEFKIHYLNKTALGMTSKGFDDVFNNDFFKLFKTDDCDSDNCIVKDVVANGGMKNSETYLYTNSGVTYVRYIVKAIEGPDGKIVGAVVIFNDITDIKVAQEKTAKEQVRTEKITQYQRQEIKKLLEVIDIIASGDFRTHYDVSEADDDTEEVFGNFMGIKESLNKMIADLSAVIAEIKDNANTVASASEELSVTSSQMFENSEIMSGKSEQVSMSTEHISNNINTLAAAAEQISVNLANVSENSNVMTNMVTNVANSAEKMNMSIAEISENVGKAAMTADSANSKAAGVNKIMEELEVSVSEIGEVVDVIDAIAVQTNLLALNAAIEAARAGEAGKGFAVVAEEIRKLAEKTTKSTSRIAETVKHIGGNSEQVNLAVKEITSIINDINETQSTINVKVDQQTKLTSEISENMTEAADVTKQMSSSLTEVAVGSEDVAKNANEISAGANEVARNIADVTSSSLETKSGAEQTQTASQDLAEVSLKLQNIINKFKL